MIAVRQWSVFEAVLESDRDYDNPFWDVTVAVQITTSRLASAAPSMHSGMVVEPGGSASALMRSASGTGRPSHPSHMTPACEWAGRRSASRTRATTRSTSMVPCAWPPAVTTWSMLTGHRSCG